MKEDFSSNTNNAVYNDSISFVLPDDYRIVREEDEDGEENVRIIGESYLDEDGEQQYDVIIDVYQVTIDRSRESRPIRKIWLDICENKENTRCLSCQTTPESMFVSRAISMTLFTKILQAMSVTMFVRVSDDSFLTLTNRGGYDEDSPDENLKLFEQLLAIAKCVRIHGEPMGLGDLRAQALLKALEPDYSACKPVDSGLSFTVSIHAAGESTTFEYDSSSLDPKITSISIDEVTPEENLYPHYKSTRQVLTAMLGCNVNTTGTEYEFLPLRKLLEIDPDDDASSEEHISILRRLVSADTGFYDLHKNAEQMLPLFRVNRNVFDPKHDRECELADGLMHRAYMMSALRSFAWSLSDWCQKKSIEPKEVTFAEIESIVYFIKQQDWLNYDDTSYCKGLCGCQDLHVYYVPDKGSDADKQALLPSKEYLEQIERIKKKFPTYNEIPTGVHSLDALRKDLKYIFPAIETIYVHLQEERNRDEPLTGDVADILYAWCALALAAKEPFFSEDGPVNCWFDQKKEVVSTYTPALRVRNGREDNVNAESKTQQAGAGCNFIIEDNILTDYRGNVAEIQIPETVERISSGAFEGCKTLQRVIFPEKLSVIEGRAFRGCDRLNEIILPAMLTYIGKEAFSCCKNLNSIHLPPFIQQIDEGAFSNISENAVFHLIKRSYAERYCQEMGFIYDSKMDVELLKKLQIIVRDRKEAAERKRQEEAALAEKKGREEAAIAEKKRIEAKKREIKKQQAKNRLRKIGIIIAAITAMIMAVTVLSSQFLLPELHYNEGKKLFDEGEYQAAALELGKLSDYKSAKQESLESWKKFIRYDYMTSGARFYVMLDSNLISGAEDDDATSQWRNIVSISGIWEHSVGLKEDGTVVATGNNEYGQCEVSEWKDIVVVSAGGFHTVGLKLDGTVVATGNNEYGQCEVSEWKDIVAISAGGFHTVGLKLDGTIVVAGNNEYGQCDIPESKNIVAVDAGIHHTVALKSDGTVVAVGKNQDGQCNTSQWKDVVQISAGYDHTVGLKSDGTLVAVGSNEYGQCNISQFKDIIYVNAGTYFTGLVTSDRIIQFAYDGSRLDP